MRKLPKFDYFKAESFEEGLRILKKFEGRIQPFAGGTDVFVAMKSKGKILENVLDLKGIRDCDFIKEIDGRIEIGALTTIRSIEASPLIKGKMPFLADAAQKIGSVQVRNRGTIGGNLSNASPSADLVPPLICLKAMLEIVGENGLRRIPVEDYFLGPGVTIISNRCAILRKIIIPLLPENSAGVYFKHSPRKTMDLAIVGVGCVLFLDPERKKCMDSRIALGAVAPIPMRLKMAEAILKDKEISGKEIEEVALVASDVAKPINDIRGSAEYRNAMVKFYVRKCLVEVLKLIKLQ